MCFPPHLQNIFLVNSKLVIVLLISDSKLDKNYLVNTFFVPNLKLSYSYLIFSFADIIFLGSYFCSLLGEK